MLIHTTGLTEEITTNNLLPNAGTGQTSVQHSNSTIDGINSSTGFTLNNVTDYSSNYNELEANGTGTVSADGSLLDITVGEHTTTEDSLDGGVTLTSRTEVQNCEWTGSAHRCGQATSGQDSYSTTVTILDENDNELATVTQNRNTDSGYNNNTFSYTDTVTHTGEGARKWEWEWQGIDGNSPNSTSPVGPNLLGAELKATLLDILYSPIPEDIKNEIVDIFDDLGTEFEEIEQIVEEFFFEEEIEILEEVFSIVMEEEMIMEMEEMPMEEEVFTSILTMLPPSQQEEIYEETEEIIESFLPMVSKEEESITEEEELTETGSIRMESTEEESKEEVVKEESKELVRETNEEEKEEIKEEKPSGKTPKKSTIQTKKLAKQKTIQQKEAIKTNLVKIMDKIDKDIKDISKNLQIKNIIKLDAMASDQASLIVYENTEFYKPKNLYLNQLNIFDNRQLYPDTSLTSYIQEDPVFIKEQQLRNLDNIKKQLLYELEILKNG